MNDTLLVYTTMPTEEAAKNLAVQLLDDKLAGCINVLPRMTSLYKWKGKLEQGNEHLLMIKTHASRYAALAERIRKEHPYELPEIIAVTIERGLPEYLRWISGETTG